MRRRLLTVEKSAIQDATTSASSPGGAAELTARIDRDMADLGADEEV